MKKYVPKQQPQIFFARNTLLTGIHPKSDYTIHRSFNIKE